MSAEKAAPPHQQDDFYRSFLTGYGALFFAPTPVSGALFLLGTFAASALAGTGVMLGLLASTATAHLLMRDRVEIEQGLYGFNGALVAFGVLSISARPELQMILIMLAAALTTRMTAAMLDSRWCTRWQLPTLSLPSIVMGLFVIAGLNQWTDATPYNAAMLPSFLQLYDFWNPAFYSQEMFEAVADIRPQLPVFFLFVLGFGLYSKRLLGHLCIGLALGSLVGFAGLGWVGAFQFQFVVVTALPVYLALAVVFCVSNWASALWAALAVAISLPTWLFLGIVFEQLALPTLTLPFWLTTITMLTLHRTMNRHAQPHAKWLPHLVPLHRVGSESDAARWMKARKFGWKYWQDMERLADRDWRDFSDEERMERGRTLVRQSRRIVLLTGAGMSTESNIPDYRSGAIAWKQYDTSHFRWKQFLASEQSRQRYWEMSQDFYLTLRTAEPNAGHLAIAELHRREKLLAVVTQNVDRLHQAAGLPPQSVIEIHGNEHSVHCLNCGKQYTRDEIYRWIVDGVTVPYCTLCQGILKPDSVAFDQPMPEIHSSQALQAIQNCDLLVVAGTSLEVQPVSTLPLLALRANKPLILVNLQPTDYDAFATCVFRGTCGTILPELFAAQGE
ncbi:MAG: urea transporter [Planctomycetes bacterium]|nr:urea transporter [Planctomycetota bacterium]